VPDVVDELEVVEGAAVVVVTADVVVVDEELEDGGLLEQAASTRAHAGTISSRIHQVRNALGMGAAYGDPVVTWGFHLNVAPPACHRTRAGTVPMTDARSMERRWGQ
jgi:hypothetical protein